LSAAPAVTGIGEPEVQAAAADGRQQRIRPGREEEDRRARGRFLERLQEGVRRRRMHAVGLVHDRNLAVRDLRRHLDAADQVARRIGGDLAGFADRPERKEVRMLLRREIL
jgi:hypothetical protein